MQRCADSVPVCGAFTMPDKQSDLHMTLMNDLFGIRGGLASVSQNSAADWRASLRIPRRIGERLSEFHGGLASVSQNSVAD
ncbi:hypothetical protein FKM82_029420 [Ascaphus truei]